MFEERHTTWTVHRLQGEHPVIFRGGGEHVVAVVGPMPRYLPQAAVHHVRRVHFHIARIFLACPHVVDQLLKNRPTPWMPENGTRCVFLKVE